MAKHAKRRRTSRGLPTYIWAGGLVGLLLIGAGLIFLAGRQGSSPSSTSLPYPNVPRISPAEAHRQQQAGDAVIIDVRAAQSYQETHAAGALSFPENELLELVDQLPKDKTLILY